PLVLESATVSSDGVFAYSAGGFQTSAPTDAFYSYDPLADAWTTLALLPQALYDAKSAFANTLDRNYVFGGIDASGTVLDTTYIYDVATDMWSSGATMPGARFFPNVVYNPLSGTIYVIGGADPGFNVVNQTWEYDPVANTWNTSRANI